ncbi:hypothetical protein B6N38_05890 [Cutibacterium avidum]|nr:hypothetical protein B6N39_07895 [Cutibacterium avidum]PGX70530.1 hypothetical protein B6N38_05890 [Cutibacterium avidum]
MEPEPSFLAAGIPHVDAGVGERIRMGGGVLVRRDEHPSRAVIDLREPLIHLMTDAQKLGSQVGKPQQKLAPVCGSLRTRRHAARHCYNNIALRLVVQHLRGDEVRGL